MEPFSNKVVCCSFRVDLFSAWDEVYDLSMPVNHELKCIVPIYLRQASNKVGSNHLTRAIRDFVGLKGTLWLSM